MYLKIMGDIYIYVPYSVENLFYMCAFVKGIYVPVGIFVPLLNGSMFHI